MRLAFQNQILVFVAVVWVLVYVVWDKITKNRGKLRIYPLIIIYESSAFKKLIERLGSSRKDLWRKIGGISDKIFPIVMFFAIIYITLNLIAQLRKALLIMYGVPIGSRFVIIIPFLTLPPSKLLVMLIFAFAPAVVAHEFFHGTVSIAEDVDLESTGFFFSLGLFGGFVEPELEKLMKSNNGQHRDMSYGQSPSRGSIQRSEYGKNTNERNHHKKIRRILSAGILANIVLASIFFVAYYSIGRLNLCEPYGLRIVDVADGSPAQKYGIRKSDIIVRINGTRIRTFGDLEAYMANVKPGSKVVIDIIRNREIVKVELIVGEKNGKPWIGITVTQYYRSNVPWISDELMFDIYFFTYLNFIVEFLVVVLNVLPCFILDGAQWLRVVLYEKYGGRSHYLFILINAITTIILLLNFIAPIVSTLIIK